MNTLNILLTYALDHYQTWLAYLWGSATIALIVQSIKKKWHLEERLTVWKIDAKKFIVLLLGVVSVVFSLADAILSNTGGTPLLHLFPQAAQVWPWLVALAVIIHRFALSGVWKRLENLLQAATDYKAYKAATAQQPAVQPAPPTFEG